MTPIEERLRQALTEEAEARPVDAARLRRELDERIARPPRRSRLLLMAAAAVLLVGGSVVGIQVLRGGDDAADSASSGRVEDAFSCPAVQSVDLSGSQDEFRPDLVGRTPAEVAAEYDAPRWEFVADGETAVLRLGNEDGSLGSATRYELRDGEWRLVGAQVCSNSTSPDPSSDSLRLGRHGFRPHPPPDLEFEGNAAPVLVDDRPIYDRSGLVTQHRSLYLAPCGAGLCFATEGQDAIGDRMPTFSGRDAGILGNMCWFFVPDPLVGRASPYTLMVAWDATRRSTDFIVVGSDGTYQGRSYTDPSWGRQRVWLALVPTPPPGVELVSRLFDADSLVDQNHAPVECD